MDSLQANYGSSDEEDGGRQAHGEKRKFPPPRPPASGISSSAPPPKSSFASAAAKDSPSVSLFRSLPLPKNSPSSSIFSSLPPPKSAGPSIFSSLPQPKSLQQKPLPPPEHDARTVVRPGRPTDVPSFNPADVEEDEDEIREKRRKKTLDFSSKPLSSIIPAPKNTLCLAPAASSSLRRSIVEAAPAVSSIESSAPEQAAAGAFGDAHGGYEGQWGGEYAHQPSGAYAQSDAAAVGGEPAAAWPSTAGSYEAHAGYGGYEGYENYGAEAASSMASVAALGRRGRKEIPSEIIEVKQEELVKNRPREDQVRLTGIAFGPAYQPEASSGKGKPSKLHKRKHQIGALYFDMRQKETELAERRSRGLLTKKETQAKYGW